MDKNAEKKSSKTTGDRMKEQKKGDMQVQARERFLAATTEELIISINELTDGIILEVYFEDESR